MSQHVTKGELEDLKARVKTLEAKQIPKTITKSPKSKPEIKE